MMTDTYTLNEYMPLRSCVVSSLSCITPLPIPKSEIIVKNDVNTVMIETLPNSAGAKSLDKNIVTARFNITIEYLDIAVIIAAFLKDEVRFSIPKNII